MLPVPALGPKSPIRPHPVRRDWFSVPKDWLPELNGAPRMQYDSMRGVIIHRSHLPLLAKNHVEVEIFLREGRSLLGPDQVQAARDAFDATTEPNDWKLRDYQHVGREFIQSRRGTLLADSMRVGKTAQLIAAHNPDTGPMFVVAPLATREVWITWFKRRWPDVRPTVLHGRTLDHASTPIKPKRDRGYDILDGENFDADLAQRAKLIFCNYDILGAWKEFEHRKIGTLVFDEIHVLSRRNSRRSESATFMATKAHMVIGATGTPIWNKPAGLFTTLQCIGPAAFGSFFEFAKQYADAHPGPNGWIYDGASNEEEFKLRMSEIMLRRTWQEISGQLPAIDRSVEVVDISEAQQFQVEKEAERVRDHATRATNVGALARFRRLLAKLKIDTAVDVAHRILLSGEKVIVWTWHRDIAMTIEERLGKLDYPGFVVTGTTGMDIREDVLNRWRNHPGPAPLVITLSVGQVGIDLTAAQYEVFAELDFTPAVVAQAEMRPFSPLRPCFATYCILDHPIDRKILAALQDKCDTAYSMGVPAAESTIGVLNTAFSMKVDGASDFEALARAIMLDHPDLDSLDENDDYHGALWDKDWEAAE